MKNEKLEENILDEGMFIEKRDEVKDDPKLVFWVSVTWWEKNRLNYNILLIGVELFMILIHIKTVIEYFGIFEACIWSILYTLAANVFYTIGWASEILLIYYAKFPSTNNDARSGFLLIGQIFSVILTIWMYTNAIG